MRTNNTKSIPISLISLLVCCMTLFSGCRTALEKDTSAAAVRQSSPNLSRPPAPAPAPAPAPISAQSAANAKSSEPGIAGTYFGSVDSVDQFTDENFGSQAFTATLQTSLSPIDPRQAAVLHFVSDGDFFSGVDYTVPLDLRLSSKQADGHIHLEFLGPCEIIQNLTATKARIQLILNLDGSNLVDSSQSTMNILDCGFSGNADSDRLYQWAEISAFGKR